jgi:penicillin amidase
MTQPNGDHDRLFNHIHGAGLRAVYDLADLDGSRFMIAPGQSGNPLSRNYRDLIAPWASGETLTLGPVNGQNHSRLVLEP